MSEIRIDRHVSEDDLVLYLYGELSEGPASGRQAVDRHLSSCDACRESSDRLRRLFRIVDEMPVPERPETYGSQVWQRVRGALHERERRGNWRNWFSIPRLSLAAGIAMLVVVAFVFGRFSGTPGGTPISPEVRERILLVAVGDHLERSQRLLLELSHVEGAGLVDIAEHQSRAEELAVSNRLYRQTASRGGDDAMADVLDELERVLLEIANSPSAVTPASLQDLRSRIERRGIVFKIRVIGERARDEGRTAKPSTAGTSSQV